MYEKHKDNGAQPTRTFKCYLANRGIKRVSNLLFANGEWRNNKEVITQVCSSRGIDKAKFIDLADALQASGLPVVYGLPQFIGGNGNEKLIKNLVGCTQTGYGPNTSS